MKPLVVVYSRTGPTKKIAEAIADVLECDIEEVFDTKKSGRYIGSKQHACMHALYA